MIVVSEEEFAAQAVSYSSQTQIIFQNKLFTRGPDFAKKYSIFYSEYCQHYPNKHFLVVDRDFYVSVWREESKYINHNSNEESNINLRSLPSRLSIAAQKQKLIKFTKSNNTSYKFLLFLVDWLKFSSIFLLIILGL